MCVCAPGDVAIGECPREPKCTVDPCHLRESAELPEEEVVFSCWGPYDDSVPCPSSRPVLEVDRAVESASNDIVSDLFQPGSLGNFVLRRDFNVGIAIYYLEPEIVIVCDGFSFK